MRLASKATESRLPTVTTRSFRGFIDAACEAFRRAMLLNMPPNGLALAAENRDKVIADVSTPFIREYRDFTRTLLRVHH